MASAKSYLMPRRASNYRFLSNTDPIQSHSLISAASSDLELDESDVWGGSTRSESPESRTPPTSSRPARRTSSVAKMRRCGEAASLPVNIPDWSKILREEYKEKWSGREKIGNLMDYGGDDGGDCGSAIAMPPHEYLARTRMASFSVHEGIGRTLKGRDLSRVRNAILEKTGFQD